MTTKLNTQETKPRGELYCDTFTTENESHLCMAITNSNLFYWYFTIYSDCRHMNRRDVLSFPFDLNKLSNEAREILVLLSKELQEDFIKNKSLMNKSGLQIETFSAEKSKPIIDEIDRVLGQHYGFTPEELDFIMNYDIKYRMGRDNGEESEE